MHEFAITKSIINMVQKQAESSNANRVTKVILVVGDLSAVVDESVQMYFDILSEDTLACGAELVFKRVKTQFQCGACGNKFLKEESGFDCPLCSQPGVLTGVGREFYIESIEIE